MITNHYYKVKFLGLNISKYIILTSYIKRYCNRITQKTLEHIVYKL